MALDLYGPTLHAAIADDGEHIVSTLPEQLAPICDMIWDRFYDGPHLDASGVAAWRSELVAIRRTWELQRRKDLVQERKIRATEPTVLERILSPMLANDRTLAILGDLIAVCDDAIRACGGLRCISD